MNEQLLKKLAADVLSSSKKLKKTYWGGGGGIHHHLLRCTFEGKYNDYKFYTTWEISAIWLAQSSGISA